MRARHSIGSSAGCLAALLLSSLPAAAQNSDGEAAIAEVVVTSQRREQPRLLHAGNIERIGPGELAAVGHIHIHELLTRVPGMWLSRGSGQEHLTAMRSPVLTGAGSCGAFLFLEDGIPTRPAGFCNVNALFEVGAEQARSVEVVRGPGNALYGSNALHGIINTLMPMPGAERRPNLSLEIGANEFLRGAAHVPFEADAPWLATAVVADDGGFRDDAGYRQVKLHAKRAWQRPGGGFVLAATATDLDQETAGFILGEDAYRDPALRRSNPNPEAFRRASAQRIYAVWTKSLEAVDLDVRPYLRHSDMDFLPGQPLEENGHTSLGAIATASFERAARRTIVGLDIEFADMFLVETQENPTEGSPFLMETRPAGKHYDYDVTSTGIAAYVQTEVDLSERLSFGAGLRLDWLAYDYDNRMLDGNTRDDGTPCGFGGCLYTRPADRDDSYTNLAPKLSLTFAATETSTLFASLARGFRAPQATELYRLQSGQQVADLDPERIDSLEVGARRVADRASWEVALFAMRKRDSTYRDADGFNVTGARSRHRGIEASLDVEPAPGWSVSFAATYARHVYDFDVVAARGETFSSGNDVDTAPRWLGNLEIGYRPGDRLDFALQWAATGSYYLDAENDFEYPGHTVASLRAGVDLSPNLRLVLRLNNVTDRLMADRADYAFGNYRYFPGRGRELFAQIRYTPNESL